ncbi:PRTRC system ParB family protein [Thioalkalivibrio sp. ALE16]|uniref:PRTRC system ParB family protein n=1 Tax=Thioalkalivibrio sp. ALE16 TaxID=1158172 RepID=UPI000366A0A7|nr:PRTRC system ParB family protein [Thioalkalivibrio sp. ALE16]
MEAIAEVNDLIYVPLGRLTVEADFNPRRYFDAAAEEDMKASVAKKGVLQPLVVRPGAEDGTYRVIAGERRLRAAQAAALSQVPVIVRDVDDEEARVLATIENVARADMSPTEEADAARKVVSACGGDHKEACKVLGWSRSKLDSRLLLLNCTDAVKDALAKGEIKTGHAELLASVPTAVQDASLPKIVEGGVTVQMLRDRIGSYALELSSAVFDRSGCVNCPHNSSTQAALFEEHIGEGRCTLPSCFNEKTEAAMQARKADLVEQFPAVRLDTEAEPNTHTIILVKDVGEAQMAACKGCASYGAILSTNPDRIGRVTEDVCFDLTCHGQKVKAHAEAQKAWEPGNVEANAGVEGAAQDSASETPSPNTPSAAPEKPKKASKESSKVQPRKVIETAQKIRREVAAKRVQDDPVLRRAMLIASLLPKMQAPEDASDTLNRVTGQTGTAGKIAALAALDQPALDTLMLEVVTQLTRQPMAGGFDVGVNAPECVTACLESAAFDWSQHYALDADFLDAHTKSGIESVLTQTGFSGAFDAAKGEGSFKALMGKKKPEIIDGVMNSGLDLSQFIPDTITNGPKATGGTQ